MKLSLLFAALMMGCHATAPAPVPDMPAPPTKPQMGLHVTVDSSHCRESQHQPDNDMFVSLVCIADDGQGAVGVLLTITDWAVLRKF